MENKIQLIKNFVIPFIQKPNINKYKPILDGIITKN